MLEPLETRRLFSAILDFGTLRVTGTEGADDIRVWNRGESIAVRDNGQISLFGAAQVRAVTVLGLDGDDRILCRGIRVPTELYGHDGRDTLLGGRANDVVTGGDGDDRLYGMGGDDELRDVQGHDRHFGGAGSDRMTDPSGANRFAGSSGADSGSYVEGRTRVAGVETRILLAPLSIVHPRPEHVAVTFRRDDTGAWLADVEVQLMDTSYVLTMGSPTRSGNEFLLPVTLEQQSGGALNMMVVKRETFDLGRLAPGTYQFGVSSSGQLVATVSLLIA